MKVSANGKDDNSNILMSICKDKSCKICQKKEIASTGTVPVLFSKPITTLRTPIQARVEEAKEGKLALENGHMLTGLAKLYQELAGDAPVETETMDYYNGLGTLNNMIACYGKEATRSWCLITAHKYIERMGLKPGNSLEAEKKKALWYLGTVNRLTVELASPAI